jgi:hypothetical protein
MMAANVSQNRLELGFYNGTAYNLSTGWSFPPGGVPVVGDWYSLTVRVSNLTGPPPTQPPGGGTPTTQPVFRLVTATLSGVTQSSFPTMVRSIPTGMRGVHGSKFGLGSVNSHCRFSFFQLGAT